MKATAETSRQQREGGGGGVNPYFLGMEALNKLGMQLDTRILLFLTIINKSYW